MKKISYLLTSALVVLLAGLALAGCRGVSEHKVVIKPAENGTIEVKHGENMLQTEEKVPHDAVVTITPKPAEGFAAKLLKVNGKHVELTEGKYEHKVMEKTTVEAEFEAAATTPQPEPEPQPEPFVGVRPNKHMVVNDEGEFRIATGQLLKHHNPKGEPTGLKYEVADGVITVSYASAEGHYKLPYYLPCNAAIYHEIAAGDYNYVIIGDDDVIHRGRAGANIGLIFANPAKHDEEVVRFFNAGAIPAGGLEFKVIWADESSTDYKLKLGEGVEASPAPIGLEFVSFVSDEWDFEPATHPEFEQTPATFGVRISNNAGDIGKLFNRFVTLQLTDLSGYPMRAFKPNALYIANNESQGVYSKAIPSGKRANAKHTAHGISFSAMFEHHGPDFYAGMRFYDPAALWSEVPEGEAQACVARLHIYGTAPEGAIATGAAPIIYLGSITVNFTLANS
jgi:hypothetical protein